MPQTRTIRARSEMDQAYYETLVQLIRSQGYRELAAATVFAEALHLVPGLAFKKKVVQHVNEEMEHFEVCCDLYEEIGAGDLEVVASAILRERTPIPRIESFLELGIAQFLYDRASAFQLREYENCSFDPYCRIVGKILEEEEGHESFGAEIMVEHGRDAAQRARMQEIFNKWFAVSLRSFGRPGTPGNRYAISVGLKTRDSAAVAQEYLDGLRTVMRLSGIVFPTREELKRLGVETSPDIDLRL
ncbi:MAG TPA: Phenylacetic acid catabolic protein [Planctomycetota bacterium]|nr:Phenylacetic acid catabolic protein [Planctomycetota bacterium]